MRENRNVAEILLYTKATYVEQNIISSEYIKGVALAL